MTEKTLQELIQKYHVPQHIQAHMKKVAEVALFLGNRIVKNGEIIDLTLLRQAALLHDIVKICDFKILDLKNFKEPYTIEDVNFWNELLMKYAQVDHTQAAYEILSELHEPALAITIKRHQFKGLIDPKEKPSTWEEKILYYADKRVKHDQLVSIFERLEDGRKRYYPDGKIPKEDSMIEKALMELEKEICTKVKLEPEEIMVE